MKRFLIVLFMAIALPAFAQHQATGVVTRAPANGRVTIKHDPVPSLNWPGMTMGFAVKDKAVADKLKQGAKVQFQFVKEGRDYVVTSVK
jgi:Cu(I)/Ag(I) efflux system periplasmic protein CusF